QFKRLQFTFLKCVANLALNIQHTKECIACKQRQHQSCLSVGQRAAGGPVFVVCMIDKRTPLCNCLTDNGVVCNRDFQSLLQQHLSSVAITISQYGVLPHIIQHEHLREMKLIYNADQVNHAVHECVHICLLRGLAADAC